MYGRPQKASNRGGLRARLACVLVLGLLSSACAEQAPAPLDSSTPADRFAVLSVSYAEHRIPGGAEPQLVLGGFFARHHGISQREVLDILHLPDVPDAPTLGLAPPQCIIVERQLAAPILKDPYESYVDLLDAGELRLEFAGRTERLRRRNFPGLFSAVSGMTYEGSLDSPAPAGGGAMRLEGRGSHEVGDFRVDLRAPPVPRLIEVDGDPVTGAWAHVEWDRPLTVRWLSAETDSSGVAPVFIEIAVLKYDRTIALRCAAADDGRTTIEPRALQQVATHITSSSTVRLVARRISRAPFAAPGIHSGEAFFVSRDSVLLK